MTVEMRVEDSFDEIVLGWTLLASRGRSVEIDGGRDGDKVERRRRMIHRIRSRYLQTINDTIFQTSQYLTNCLAQ